MATEISATTPSAPFVDAETVTLNFVDYVDEQPWLYNNMRFWAVKGNPNWSVAGYNSDGRGFITLWGQDAVQVNRPTYQVKFEAPENGFYSFAFTVGGTLKDVGSYIPVRVDDGDWYHIMYSTSAYNNPNTYYGMDNIYLEAGEHVFGFSKAVGTAETQYYWGFQYTYEAHTHTEVILPAVEATCTTTGLTEGKTCSDCGNIIVAQKTVPFKHVPGAEATCTTAQTCTICGEVLVEALGHTYAAATRIDEAHPHAIYNVCICGEEQATGEYAELDSCAICNPIATKPEGTVHYGTPVIDGEMDDIYAGTLTIVYDGNNEYNTFKDLGWADAKATVYAMYDEQYVYFYAVVEDDDVYMADASYYEQYNPYGIDAIEFRLNFGGQANAANQFKITLDAYGVQAFNIWTDRYPYTTIDTYATALTDNGYVLELAVPHTVEGTDNTNLIEAGELGFNMWLVDLFTSGSTAPVHGTDFYMYGLNYGSGNGVAEYYELEAKAPEHVCDFTYGTETDAEHPHAVYGVCECGEKQLQAESSDKADCLVCHPFKLFGSSMTLGNALDVNFFINISDIPANAEGYYAVIRKAYADGTSVEKVVPFSEWADFGGYGIWYYITFDGVAAKEMADTFDVQVFNGADQAVSEVFTDSIKGYITRKFDSFKDKEKTWAVDCLNYGAAAQVAFEYDTANLANKDLTAEQQALGTQNVEMTNSAVLEGTAKGAALTLESNILLTVYFSGIDNATDMYAEISFTDHYGNAVSKRVDGSEFTEEFKGMLGWTGVKVEAVVAADVSQLVTVTVYNADGSVHGVIKDSIESYAARKTQGDDIFSAVVKFGKASYNMFH